MPTPLLHMLTPFEKIFNVTPSYAKLRIFGCLCYPWVKPYNSHKLEPRSRACIFLGYSLTQSAYNCLDLETDRMFVSRHVNFVESVFPYHTLHNNLSRPAVNTCVEWLCSAPSSMHVPISHAHSSPSQPALHETLRQTSFPDSRAQAASPAFSSSPTAAAVPSIPSASASVQGSLPSPSVVSAAPGHATAASGHASAAPGHATAVATPVLPVECAQSSPQPLSAQAPTLNPPLSTHTDPHTSPPVGNHPMVTRSKNNIHKPITKLSLTSVLLPTQVEPTCVSQALKFPEWRRAMSEEFDALVRNNTWTLVPSQSSSNTVGCKWVFRIKRSPDGSISKYKARLVAKGFHQRPGVDFTDTFSPVVKTTTIRVLLSIAVSRGWSLRQLDVNNAFLQGHLDENVFMEQPAGFIDPARPLHVCHLNKAIYGLKQAPRAWYNELRQFLLQNGFVNSQSDTSLFILNSNGCVIFLLVYVDDIIVTGNDVTSVNDFIATLARRFSIKDLGGLSYFLGVEVTSCSAGLFLSQQKYITDLLHRTKMFDAKPVSTPLPTDHSITLLDGTSLTDATEFRRVIGALQYLSFTRPDIAFAVNKLAQFMHRPTTGHWSLAKRLLRYLRGTLGFGLVLHRNSSFSLHAFSDADWAGNQDDRSSTSAYVVFLGSNAISWCSRKQRSIARSSTEAEYRAVATTASEVIWLSSLLKELLIPAPSPPVIYCDNIGATYLCSNPVFHSRMKHIAIDFHFVREKVQSNQLRISHVSSSDQLADSLTKPLSRTRFCLLRSKISVSEMPTILRGRVKDICV
ncbi:hypothetical protein LWI29_023729 [Acer saccharum]|uniref:Reverse transcriptase Ty1/copia-type domain-containing protein n=1 Tax=Acer saccharum TaxID=4024 RepID=A0AA39TG95_ACESA|nr:hypothetical protein LWI29_023729 [Acer saccharum]